MGQKINVAFFPELPAQNFKSLSAVLDPSPRYSLSNTPWPQFTTTCSASFSMVHTHTDILLKFFVEKDYFQSRQREINGSVHKDNCVEFFISFNNDEGYYNIEFNCLGTGKMAFGAGNKKRTFLQEENVRKIKTFTVMNKHDGHFDWEMILVIPAEAFEFHRLAFYSGLICRGNFYKCGDELPQPHFLSWSNIKASKPDFHQPEFFGSIAFC